MRGRQRQRWGDNVTERTGTSFKETQTLNAAELYGREWSGAQLPKQPYDHT